MLSHVKVHVKIARYCLERLEDIFLEYFNNRRTARHSADWYNAGKSKIQDRQQKTH
jgi:hypothetical protein